MSVHQFHPRASNHPTAPVGWQHTLDQAGSEHQVVMLVRDYVASLDPYQVASLPPQCRPGKFVDAEDITSFAFEVVRYHCEQNDKTRELVHRIAAFFSYASTRLSQIMARGNNPESQ